MDQHLGNSVTGECERRNNAELDKLYHKPSIKNTLYT